MIGFPVGSRGGCQDFGILALKALNRGRNRVVLYTKFSAAIIWISVFQQSDLIFLNFYFILGNFFDRDPFIRLSESNNFLTFLLSFLSLAERLRSLANSWGLWLRHWTLWELLYILFLMFEIEITDALFRLIFRLSYKIVNLHWK